MKRSDMVIKIMDFLLEEIPKYYDNTSSYTRRLDAQHLLDLIEENGMIPPTAQFEVPDKIYGNQLVHIITERKWEEE